ncbi:MAG: hydrogenase maturation nickel metallochaperone HypA, partial [bacterium]|nr:hydrogenase maturation nickel metallochaperone HypA [bacterium]
MHELQVTEKILNIALKHAAPERVKKIVKIYLEIGELAELEDEWIQNYFDYLSKDTLAEDAKLIITR